MKESKTTTIAQILENLEEEKRNIITTLYDECMKSICCENIQWTAFECFTPSCKMMELMLNALAPEYIMAVADKLNQEENTKKTVKITFVITKDETSVYTINQNFDTILVYISLSKKRVKELKQKVKI